MMNQCFVQGLARKYNWDIYKYTVLSLQIELNNIGYPRRIKKRFDRVGGYGDIMHVE